jgi:hypothetical protein
MMIVTTARIRIMTMMSAIVMRKMKIVIVLMNGKKKMHRLLGMHNDKIIAFHSYNHLINSIFNL